MKNKILNTLSAVTIIGALVASICVILSGCGTISKNTTPTGTEYIVNTNSPTVLAIEAARAVNAATPSPVQPLITLGLSTALAGLGAYARFRTLRANQQLAATVDAIESLPEGVEKERAKASVAKATSSLNPIVEKVTE